MCDNLVQEAEKRGLLVNNKDHHVEADLFSLLLSYQESAFSVLFPASPQFLKRFSCQVDFKGYRLFEFHIQVLRNFTWQNTGLALCVAGKENIYWEYEIHINKVLVRSDYDEDFGHFGFSKVDRARVWLHYIPFNRMSGDRSSSGYRRPLPPFECRVTIYQTLSPCIVPWQSCGVHLVMPPNEECMEVCHAQNLTDRLEAENYRDDELQSSDRRLC